MSSRTRRTAFLSVLVLILGVVAGVGFAAAQTDTGPASAATDPAEPATEQEPATTTSPDEQQSAEGKRSHGGRLDAAAGYLGLTTDALRERLVAGESLASVAEATSGMTVAGLRAALIAAFDDRLAQTDRFSDEEKVELRARIEEHVDRLIQAEGLAEHAHRGRGGDHRGFGRGDHGRRHGHGDREHGLARGAFDLGEAVSDYLGLERESIREQLRDGSSLGQIADATPVKSAEGLTQALTQAADEAIEASEGLSAEQQTMLRERLAERIESLVSGERGNGHGFGRHGEKGFDAPAPSGADGAGEGAQLTPSDLNTGAAALLL